MAGYIGSKAVSVNTTSATITGDASIGGNVTLNDGSADVDFRVESNVSGDTHALFVDGATGHVGLGTSVLGAQFNVKGTGAVDAGIGSTNAGGAYLYLDGDSNGDFSGSDYSFIGHQTDGQLIINQDSPSGTQALLIKTAGTLAATISSSGINLADGNLTVALGHGIDFSATADGAGTDNSSLLDDYEEGSWTPLFGDNSTSASGASQFSATYVRIGRLVTVSADITCGSYSGANANYLRGLPYTGAVSSTGNGGGGIGYTTTASIVPGLHVTSNTNAISFMNLGTTTGGEALAITGKRFIFSLTYETAQ